MPHAVYVSLELTSGPLADETTAPYSGPCRQGPTIMQLRWTSSERERWHAVRTNPITLEMAAALAYDRLLRRHPVTLFRRDRLAYEPSLWRRNEAVERLAVDSKKLPEIIMQLADMPVLLEELTR